MGLCLSGGGYRAALFHLGALRRLDELGVLGQVRTISAVSGGAIIANLLADPRLVWPEPPAPDADRHERPGPGPAAADGPPPGHGGRLQDGRVQGFEELVAAPLERLAQRNIRTPALLTRLLPWRWTMPDGATRALADQLADAVPWWSTPLRDNGVGHPQLRRRCGVAQPIVADTSARVLHVGAGEGPVDPVGDLGGPGDDGRSADRVVAQWR